ncbi:beta-lactamase class A [Kitasatospora gansuensis]|uniref:Beta-lactamase class A n=1 Tax=Kitasatospora gansuensis TaxID=258050 RepID=A0A7W7WFP7_9ACTN|nr:serine hydrolase [Kitasatospora gansuensis]MBB4945421.1 beta-lactamase class A [Kitasatospora gansuensis]
MAGTHRKQRPLRTLAAALVLALAAVALYLLQAPPSRSTPVANVQPVTASASPTPTDPDPTPAVQAAAAAVAAQGAVSVAVLDTESGVSASYGTGSFVTASIAKADILAALLWQRQQAGRELTAAERAAATLMIEQSDNTAADTLYTAVGEAAGLDAANRAFGLTATTAGADGHWGLTETTAADQLRLLQVVFGTESPLTADRQAYLQGLMGQVATDQDWGVSAADQDGAYTLKNGWLPRTATGLWVVNSIGRVTHDGRELLVAVLSEGSADQQRGIDTVESLAEAATGALTAQLTTELTG